jgi:hypothetical protein
MLRFCTFVVVGVPDGSELESRLGYDFFLDRPWGAPPSIL